MIIDAHTHIFEAGRGGPFQLPSGAADFLREMDAAGVAASIVLPLHAGCAFLCRRLPAGRVLYGSDFPNVPFAENVATARALLDDATADVKTAVLSGAAARRFGIAASGACHA